MKENRENIFNLYNNSYVPTIKGNYHLLVYKVIGTAVVVGIDVSKTYM